MNNKPLYKKLGSDVYLIIAGLIGALIFLFGYPVQNPESAIKLSLNSEQIVQQSLNFLKTNDFNTASLKPVAKLRRNTTLLDSLDEHYGRQKVTSLFKKGALEKLPAYYWRVRWQENKSDESKSDENSANINIEYSTGDSDTGPALKEPLYSMKLTLNGQIWDIKKSHDRFAKYSTVNRSAFLYAIKNTMNVDSLQNNVEAVFFKNIDDSVLSTHLFFSFNRFTQKIQRRSITTVDPARLEWALEHNHNVLISRKFTASMARYYLRFTPWKDMKVKVDTVFSIAGTDGMVARVNFSVSESLYGQKIQPSIDITAGGALEKINTSFNTPPPSTFQWKQIIAPIVSVVTFILLILFIALVFVRRIDAKLFDTRTAITVGVIGWFLASSQVMMSVLYPFPSIEEFATLSFYLKIFIIPLFVGMLGAFLMFFTSGTGESIVRTVLPSKIESYSMVLRGYLRNHCIGKVLIRSTSIALILSGLFTLILYLFPHSPLYAPDAQNVFLSNKVLFPFLSILSKYAYMSLLTGFVVLLGMSSYSYHFISKPWVILVTGAIFGALLSVVPISTSFAISWILGAAIGLILAFIYWRFDFLTSVLSGMFLFLLWETSTGWIVANSPDLISSLLSWLLVMSTFVIGFWGLSCQITGDEIPEYVPAYVEEITQRERMERELEIARSVQESFLPRHNPHLKGFEIAAACHSALEVGGDYYDFIDLGNEKMGVAIADVSGKGIQAAFYMTLLKGFLQSLCHQIESPAKLLCQINKLFYQNAERGTFISMIYGVLDAHDRTFTFARAGHNPLVFKSSSKKDADIYKPEGLALGMTRDGLFSDHINDVTIHLVAGDVITLYTDGYTEAMNKNKDLFSDEKLVEVIEKLSISDPSQIISDITDTVNDFVSGAHQHDDMTIVVLKTV